jgi:hypothetical protein
LHRGLSSLGESQVMNPYLQCHTFILPVLAAICWVPDNKDSTKILEDMFWLTNTAQVTTRYSRTAIYACERVQR